MILVGENILLIGTDCPALDRHRLRAAAEALLTHDAVIHPTLDGGYALLGLRRFDSSLFAGIGWSGPDVAADTIARIEALGWSLHIGGERFAAGVEQHPFGEGGGSVRAEGGDEPRLGVARRRRLGEDEDAGHPRRHLW